MQSLIIVTGVQPTTLIFGRSIWELDHKEGWVSKNWCFQIVLLEKALESPLDGKEIKQVNPRGNQPWIFIGRIDADAEAPKLWPLDVKCWLIGKDCDAGKDWGQEENWAAENEMVGWHHWLNGHEFECTPRESEGQRTWCATIHEVTKSWTWLSHWTTTTWQIGRKAPLIMVSLSRLTPPYTLTHPDPLHRADTK